MIIVFPYGIVIPDFGGNKVDRRPCLLIDVRHCPRKARKYSKGYHTVGHRPKGEWLDQRNFVSFVDRPRFLGRFHERTYPNYALFSHHEDTKSTKKKHKLRVLRVFVVNKK